eukprot:COSAG01_NODE_4403_length_5060_cov_15.005644_3_plen_58_part_00
MIITSSRSRVSEPSSSLVARAGNRLFHEEVRRLHDESRNAGESQPLSFIIRCFSRIR